MGGTETRTRLFVDTVCDDDEGHDEVWAVPVDVEEGGGTYRLVTLGLDVPLVPDDVVRVTDIGGGVLVVTGVEALADRCTVIFRFDPEGDEAIRGGDRGGLPGGDLETMTTSFARALEARGVVVDGMPGTLHTAWPLGWGPREVGDASRACMADHPGWEPVAWGDAEERAEDIAAHLVVPKTGRPERRRAGVHVPETRAR